MPKKRRDLITINARKGLRFRLLAAIADIPELRQQTVTTVLPWLAQYALDILYRGRVLTIAGLIAMKAADKRFPWAKEEGDPNKVIQLMAEAADRPVERIWLLSRGEASPDAEDVSGLASAFDMEVDEVIEIAEGRGPRINGDVHATQH